MGWSAYASPLTSGQRLTAPMRAELYAALEERNNALPFPVTLDSGPNATILASPWETDLVSVNGSPGSWSDAVNAIWAAGGYIDPAQNGTVNWGAAAPSPFASLDPALLHNAWNDYRYWNAVRAAIIALTTLRIDLLAGGTPPGTAIASAATLGGPFATEALAAANLAGAAQSTSSTGEALAQILGFNATAGIPAWSGSLPYAAGSIVSYSGTVKGNFQAAVNTSPGDSPDSAPSEWTLLKLFSFSSSVFTGGVADVSLGGTVLLTLFGGGANTVAAEVAFTFGSAGVTMPAPLASTYAGTTCSGAASGSIPWSLKLPDQTNATQLAADFGAPGNQDAVATVYMGGGDGTAIGIQPTFSYT